MEKNCPSNRDKTIQFNEAAIQDHLVEMVRSTVKETLTYYQYPKAHWRRIRTNNALERIMREIRRCTRVVGTFPDGNSALMLCASRLRHLAGSKWGQRCYLNMELLKDQLMEEAIEANA